MQRDACPWVIEHHAKLEQIVALWVFIVTDSGGEGGVVGVQNGMKCFTEHGFFKGHDTIRVTLPCIELCFEFLYNAVQEACRERRRVWKLHDGCLTSGAWARARSAIVENVVHRERRLPYWYNTNTAGVSFDPYGSCKYQWYLYEAKRIKCL